MVAGAVVGISLGVLIVILIIWLVFRKKEKKKYEEEETPNEIRFVHTIFFCDFFSLLHHFAHFKSGMLKAVWINWIMDLGFYALACVFIYMCAYFLVPTPALCA